VTLRINYQWGKDGERATVQNFQVSLFDNQSASKNYMALVNYANGLKAKAQEELRKKSEQQKPF
jgi:hypothetical protein